MFTAVAPCYAHFRGRMRLFFLQSLTCFLTTCGNVHNWEFISFRLSWNMLSVGICDDSLPKLVFISSTRRPFVLFLFVLFVFRGISFIQRRQGCAESRIKRISTSKRGATIGNVIQKHSLSLIKIIIMGSILHYCTTREIATPGCPILAPLSITQLTEKRKTYTATM